MLWKQAWTYITLSNLQSSHKKPSTFPQCTKKKDIYWLQIYATLPLGNIHLPTSWVIGIQSYSQLMIGVSNHLLRMVLRFHYHSQKVIRSLKEILHQLIGNLSHYLRGIHPRWLAGFLNHQQYLYIWAMKKTWLFSIGDEILHSYMGITINQYFWIPIKSPV